MTDYFSQQFHGRSTLLFKEGTPFHVKKQSIFSHLDTMDYLTANAFRYSGCEYNTFSNLYIIQNMVISASLLLMRLLGILLAFFIISSLAFSL